MEQFKFYGVFLYAYYSVLFSTLKNERESECWQCGHHTDSGPRSETAFRQLCKYMQ
jgi:hypothetical protein